MKIAFSWDDGAPEDLKLMELHKKYEVPGIFFVPSENREGRCVLTEDQIINNSSELIEFGGHTQHHSYLTSIPIGNVNEEIRDNKVYLEDLLGKRIKHFCLPGGKYNREILKKVYSQYETCRTADTMSFSSHGKLLIPTFHFYPRGIRSLVGNAIRNQEYQMGRKSIIHARMEYFELLRLLTDEATKIPDSQIVIWGHSWEIEACGLWNQLESYMSYVKGNYPKQIVPYGDLFVE